VQVLYANLLFASLIGEKAYARICDAPGEAYAGERFFARCAFGLPPLGRRARRMFEPGWRMGPNKDWEIAPDASGDDGLKPLTLPELRRLERYAKGFVEVVARAVSERYYRIVGCTTTFAQTAASVALLNRIKALSKGTTTILGGANCEGEMAKGIASLPSGIDHVFSGESEATFPQFVLATLAGLCPAGRTFLGEPCRDLDALPTPTFVEFYAQRRRFHTPAGVPTSQTEIPYETSRGCWWGEKHHCTFCGLSGETIAFRQKSPDRVIQDLRTLLDTHPTRKVLMVDNIMPHAYFRLLLPRLASEIPGHSIYYEVKANLSLSQVLALKRAGITSIQPGIESLSSSLLTLMNKGIQARQNLMLLRYARATGIHVDWFLLWGFPEDQIEAYKETLSILPLLHHLQPPLVMGHLSIDRFSPYFCRPRDFGIHDIKPPAGCYDWLPRQADPRGIECHFTAEYPCGSHDHVEVIRRMWLAMKRWQAAWKGKRGAPDEELRLFRRRRSYVLVDTRRLRKKQRSYPLDEKGASMLLNARPYSGSELEAWALNEKLALIMDGWFVPLAVADPRILLKLMGNHA
jgi:ribosomal peptide maturation radical SAM protein 1